MIELDELVADFAAGMEAVDAMGPVGASKTRTYRPGIGPLTEDEALTRVLEHLKLTRAGVYEAAGPRAYPESRQKCDLVLPGQWAIEAKLLRPFGDNGAEAENWSVNILHPYPGNISSVGDCHKLIHSGFAERKAVLVFGYEHIPARIPLGVAINSFEAIANHVSELRLSRRYEATTGMLIHPVHSRGLVFAWEVGPRA